MKSFLLITSLLAGCCCSTMAAPFVFNDGDIVIGFRATSGTGTDKNVFFRVGSGTDLRDGLISGTLGNIGATLSANFGSDWYSRPDLYCGAIGNLNTGSPTGTFATPPVAGDPSRTFYLTKPASYPRGGEMIAAGTYNSSALGSAGTKFSGMEAMAVTLTAETDTSAVLDQSTQSVEWNNGWSQWNPVPGAAFDTITDGIQQNFGKATAATYLDLQRVLPTSTGASPAGVVGGGEYVATVYIENDGTIKVMKAPFVLNNGDVVLGFQATGGTGADKNVFFRLGSGTDLRDGLVSGVVGNIGNTLSATFGPDWYSRTDLYCGAIGNLNVTSSASPTFTGPVNGDPSRTLYVTKPADFPQEGELIAAGTYTSGSLGSVGTKFSGMETMLATLKAEADTSGILNQLTQSVEWNNGWSSWNPVPGAAFDTLTGGIQQNFGKTSSATYLDLQRVLPTNTGASPAGVVGGGAHEATILIESDGAIKVIGTSAYQTWIGSFPFSEEADRQSGADPDGDSMTNLQEFALGSDPSNGGDTGIRQLQTVDADGDTIRDLTLTLEVRDGVSFTSMGTALVATIDNISYRIEGSEDLATWASAVSEVNALGSGTPSAGYILKTFRLDAAAGLAGKGFLRAGVSK